MTELAILEVLISGLIYGTFFGMVLAVFHLLGGL